MTTTILSAVKAFMATYSGLESGAIILTDHINAPISYSIVPLPGEQVIETYLNGSSTRVFPFLFQTAKSTADELERIETAGFHEVLMDWLDSQTEAGTLPSLPTGKTAEEIRAVSWGYLYQEGQSSEGVYQVSCLLTYGQVAP
jgi:hypothetical protein